LDELEEVVVFNTLGEAYFHFTFNICPLCLELQEENEGKSVVILCCQGAALVPHMFCNFYLSENHKIAENATTTKARDKISTHLESLEFLDVCLTNF